MNTQTTPETEVRVKFPRPHDQQRQVKREAKRFNVVDAGRRWGKDILGVDMIAAKAVRDGQPTAWLAPTYKQLREDWRLLKRQLMAVTVDKNEQEHRLELMGGGSMTMWSLDHPDAVRGRKYARLVINEAAVIPELKYAWEEVLRATLTDLEGDAWFFGTPKGHNYFWDLWRRGQDDENGEWQSWTFPTSGNPFMAAEEIEKARADLPERVFEQEYLAAFVEDAGGVFRFVSRQADAVEQDGPKSGHKYAFGVDWGRSNDFTVVWVLDLNTKHAVKMDRFAKIDYATQVTRLKAWADRFKPTTIIAEENSMGGPLVEQLQREGLRVQAFNTTSASKNDAIQALAMAFEKGDIHIIPDQVAIGELQAYEQERLSSGMFKYGAPRNGHDDTVMALALAWQGVTNSGGFGWG